MVAKLHQFQTSIVDLPADERELTAAELLLIVWGATSDCGAEGDTTTDGNHYNCDAPKMN